MNTIKCNREKDSSNNELYHKLIEDLLNIDAEYQSHLLDLLHTKSITSNEFFTTLRHRTIEYRQRLIDLQSIKTTLPNNKKNCFMKNKYIEPSKKELISTLDINLLDSIKKN